MSTCYEFLKECNVDIFKPVDFDVKNIEIKDLNSYIVNFLDNSGYDDFTKVRWIYLLVCKIFSYDSRYYYCNDNMKREIYNKELDLNNIEEYEIICYTFCKVLIDALALIGIKGELYKEYSTDLSHVYVLIKLNGHIIKLDPTKRHDMTRTKMNNTTIDFVSDDNPEFYDELLEADTEIGESLDFGYNSLFNNGIIRYMASYIDSNARENNLSGFEKFSDKLNTIFTLLNCRSDFKRYDDIDYYYSYLLRKFNINEKIVENGIEIKHFVRPALFFRKDDKSMKDMINITWVKYDNLPPSFYMLKKVNGSFVMREIYRDEAIEILSQYENPLCQLTFETVAMQLNVSNEHGILL